MLEKTENLIIFIIVFFIILFGFYYLNKNDYNTNINTNNIEQNIVKPKNDTIYIRGLGVYQKADLKRASKIIKDFYGYPCKIIESVKTSKYMYSDDGKSLDDYKSLTSLRSVNTTLYITDELITQDNVDLRGSTLMSGNNIMVKGDVSCMTSTIIHEFGHLLGLEHCNDLTCVMGVDNDKYDSGDFCVKCKKIIGWSNI